MIALEQGNDPVGEMSKRSPSLKMTKGFRVVTFPLAGIGIVSDAEPHWLRSQPTMIPVNRSLSPRTDKSDHQDPPTSRSGGPVRIRVTMVIVSALINAGPVVASARHLLEAASAKVPAPIDPKKPGRVTLWGQESPPYHDLFS
jgi:hypothetical protein